MIGKTVGRYQIKAEIGRGGMATVYQAHDPRFKRDVAIKVLPAAFLHDPQFRLRFEREAQTIASLEHPAIVPVYDFGEYEGQLYLVMRLMPGGSLADRLADGPLTVSEAAELLAAIAPALDEAHQQGMVHRDLKPGNILFDRWGKPYLADFGIVKLVSGSETALTATGGLVGTPAYMSPEQVAGLGQLDGRSDIYALGAILFELLSGRLPYEATTPMAQAFKHVNEPVPRITAVNQSLPPAVQRVIERAMAKEPGDRYPTASALARDLQALVGVAQSPGTEQRSAPPTEVVGERSTAVSATHLSPQQGQAQAAPHTEPLDSPDFPAQPSLTAPEQPQDRSRKWLLGLGGVGIALILCLGLIFAAATQLPGLLSEPTEVAEATPAATNTQNAVADTPTTNPTPTTTPRPTATPTSPPPETDNSLAGTVVTVFGAFVGEDARRFEEAIRPFEEETGIDVQYEGSGDFETLIRVRVEAGDAPDVTAHPQPGLLADFVKAGYVVDVRTFMDDAYLSENYDQSWLDMAIMPGPEDDIMAGVWYRANVKSLVWYPKDDFEAAGYEVPETWDELLALSDQIVADGGVPWCIGIESSSATGWLATDWIEDIMLRTTTPENYDRWTSGELPFNSPEVTNAIETMGEIWFNDNYVLGGRTGIVNTSFGDAPLPMFEPEGPGCWLHRQASFIPAFFPEDAVIGETVDFFYLPPIDESLGKPVLIAGDIYAMYNDRPEVQAFMRFLATAESTEAWVSVGGFVAPHKGANLDLYPTEVDRRYAQILQDADVVRFDGSDLMPGAVGAGAFWEMMTAYVAGEVDLETAVVQIDDAWPE